MTKILTVARREYAAAVKTKAFIISIILMPLLMFGAFAAQYATRSMVDAETYRIAIVDRTPGGKIAPAIAAAAKDRNARLRDLQTGKLTGPPFEIEIVPPAIDADADAQRLALSDRTRSKELLAFVEIGPQVTEANVVKTAITTGGALIANAFSAGSNAILGPSTKPATAPADSAETLDPIARLTAQTPEAAQVRYYTNRPTLLVFRTWLQTALYGPVLQERFAAAGFGAADMLKLGAVIQSFPVIVDRGMAQRDLQGNVSYEAKNASVIVNTLVPTILMALMFIAVMTGASPLATNIIEEKQLRIAEILLGGLRPFELMLGKLLGGAATSITLAAIYFVGIFIAAQQMGVLKYVSAETIAWFILFTLIGVLMYGSLFVAAGAAVTNLKEAQTTLSPVMLIVAAPFVVMMNIVQYPNGMLAKITTYFPITSPSVSIMRAAIPNGATRLELALAAVSSIIGTLVVIWIAGRIFRAGMLLTSKPASVKEAIGWVVKG